LLILCPRIPSLETLFLFVLVKKHIKNRKCKKNPIVAKLDLYQDPAGSAIFGFIDPDLRFG
jgi:hypothetical protein